MVNRVSFKCEQVCIGRPWRGISHISNRRELEQEVGCRCRRRHLDDVVLVFAQQPNQQRVCLALDYVGPQDRNAPRQGSYTVAGCGADADKGMEERFEDQREELRVEDGAAVRLRGGTECRD